MSQNLGRAILAGSYHRKIEKCDGKAEAGAGGAEGQGERQCRLVDVRARCLRKIEMALAAQRSADQPAEDLVIHGDGVDDDREREFLVLAPFANHGDKGFSFPNRQLDRPHPPVGDLEEIGSAVDRLAQRAAVDEAEKKHAPVAASKRTARNLERLDVREDHHRPRGNAPQFEIIKHRHHFSKEGLGIVREAGRDQRADVAPLADNQPKISGEHPFVGGARRQASGTLRPDVHNLRIAHVCRPPGLPRKHGSSRAPNDRR